MTPPSPGHVTRLFSRRRAGDEDAAFELLPRVYDQLRGLADSYLRRELRFFGARDWKAGRVWLVRELEG